VKTPFLVSFFAHKRITNLLCGFDHSIAILDSGDIYTWGRNDSGQLGLQAGTKTEGYTSTPIKLSYFSNIPIKDIKIGWSYSIALTQMGDIYEWGYNYYGQLGTHGRDNELAPRKNDQLSALKLTKIFCGKDIAFFITANDEVYSCGNGIAGGLGISTNALVSVATPIPDLKGKRIIDIHCGHYIIATTDSGNIYYWGVFNEMDIVERPALFTYFGEKPKIKFFSSSSTCFAYTHLELYSWGLNFDAQLGFQDSQAPIEVLRPEKIPFFNRKKVLQIAAADCHTIALIQI